MKKKLLTILLFVAMSLSITGCGIIKNEFKVGNESDIEVENNEVLLLVKESTLTNKGATFILRNNSYNSFEYGEPYEIEIKENGKWHKINVQLNFILPAYSLMGKEEKEIKINWENGYGKLAKGDYRLIKNIQFQENNEQYNSFYVAAEFTIK